jgi:ribosomal protein L12E/L44/L45/RPP1/RPP2
MTTGSRLSGYARRVPLSSAEVRLLEEACINRDNETARSLLNVFGAKTADEVLAQIAAAPVTIRGEFMEEVKRAIEAQRRFRPRR